MLAGILRMREIFASCHVTVRNDTAIDFAATFERGVLGGGHGDSFCPGVPVQRGDRFAFEEVDRHPDQARCLIRVTLRPQIASLP